MVHIKFIHKTSTKLMMQNTKNKNKIIHILVHHQGLRKFKKNINVILCSAYHQQSTSLKSCNLHNNKLRKHKMLKSLKTLEIVVNE
jgi:hypothetical protein